MGKRRYAIVGMGAIGGFYGARLAAAGHEVHFVVRSGADEIRERGLVVESPLGDLHLHDVAVHESPNDVPEVDVVALTVKTTDTEAALPIVRDLTTRAGTVLVLQNGLGVESVVAEAAPGSTVLGGMCFICSNREAPGHIRHLDYGRVTVGVHTPDESPGGITDPVAAVVEDLAGAGVPAEAVEDLGTGRWRKLVWNIPYNGLSVVLDAGTDELMADPVTRALVRSLMEEVVAAAGACGHPIDAGFVDVMLYTTDQMTPYAPSMKLDHDAGRPMELERIYRVPIEAAATAGFDMARTSVLAAQLGFLDRPG